MGLGLRYKNEEQIFQEQYTEPPYLFVVGHLLYPLREFQHLPQVYISDSFRRSQHKKYGLGRYEIQFWRDRAFQPSPHLTKAHKIKRPVDFTIPGGNRRLFHSL